jgi:hypothetical protein
LLWFGDRGKIITGVFSLDRAQVNIGLSFEAAAPTSQLNKEAQKQNHLAVFNLTVQLYTLVLDLAERVGVPPQQLAPVAGQMVQAASGFMFQILDRFDVSNIDEVLSGLQVLERILPTPEDLGGDDEFKRSSEDAENLARLGKLEAIIQSVSGRGGDSERSSSDLTIV